jgi:hypothetical protein
MKSQASKASGFTAVRNLEGYLQGKDESEVEGLVDRMGVMGIGGESGFVDGGNMKQGRPRGALKLNLKLRRVEPTKGTLPAGST